MIAGGPDAYNETENQHREKNLPVLARGNADTIEANSHCKCILCVRQDPDGAETFYESGSFRYGKRQTLYESGQYLQVNALLSLADYSSPKQ